MASFSSTSNTTPDLLEAPKLSVYDVSDTEMESSLHFTNSLTGMSTKYGAVVARPRRSWKPPPPSVSNDHAVTIRCQWLRYSPFANRTAFQIFLLRYRKKWPIYSEMPTEKLRTLPRSLPVDSLLTLIVVASHNTPRSWSIRIYSAKLKTKSKTYWIILFSLKFICCLMNMPFDIWCRTD